MESSSGGRLFTRTWSIPPSPPKGLVFISHGFSEHSLYYNEVCQTLNRKGFHCFGHDHIGHGRSSGARTLIDNIDEYVDDVLLHARVVRREFPSTLPMFILGHSMGGMIALRACLLYPEYFKGMVLVGPLIIPGSSIGSLDCRVTSNRAPFVRSFLKVLDAINPEIVLGIIKLPKVSREKELQEFMARDELKWQRGAKVRTVLAMVDTLEDNLNMSGSLRVPFLSIHGVKDEICNVTGSRALLQKAFVQDKALLEIPGAVHNLFMEGPDVRRQTINAASNWMQERI
eukprot:TRINITY_DN3005_c0_g1_i2.p1 TRINITY_DN3005_c0_g1~~TRINITY_DN3005_c0_g1_i2.p1  ORF type:complete len:286 (+),score=78.09 TRINITY_DN3005_c0_g1_i2:110-967(+)